MKRVILLLVWLLPLALTAQDNINLQAYTPSILLSKGQWELKTFQNLYTQTQVFNGSSKVSTGSRQSWFSSINQFLFGTGEKVNLGMDLWLKHANVDDKALPRTGLTGFGPKIKFTPFGSNSRSSLQSTLLFPIANDQESTTVENQDRPFLEKDRTLWINEWFLDKQLSQELQLFLRVGVWYSIVRNSFRRHNYLETPISFFVSVFPTDKISVYVMTEYAPTHYSDAREVFSAFDTYYLQSGVGGKYQIVPGRLEVEGLYTNFWLGSQSNGAGQTFNIGLRLIR